MSTDKSLIFIFTKDRPEVLKETLNHLNDLAYRLFIIDDSSNEFNQMSNKELLLNFKNINYHGKNEFNESLKLLYIDYSLYRSVYRQLGNDEWNLGYARNYALLLARIYNAEEILFMDDDIIIPYKEIIYNTFNLLKKYDFVGSNIGGMVDDSIVGHISNELGLIDYSERTLSGGFLAFNPKSIKLPFLNIYNEDWIWLFLHSNGEKYLQPEFVIQNYSNPYAGYNEKILFQEYGEIIITGIELAKEKEKEKFELLTLNLFWKRVLSIRKAYLKELYDLAIVCEKNDLAVMISWLLQNFLKYESRFFSECFIDYLNVSKMSKIITH